MGTETPTPPDRSAIIRTRLGIAMRCLALALMAITGLTVIALIGVVNWLPTGHPHPLTRYTAPLTVAAMAMWGAAALTWIASTNLLLTAAPRDARRTATRRPSPRRRRQPTGTAASQ